MAWEDRGNVRYYYTARRVGGKVVKRYHGSGDVGKIAQAFHQWDRRDEEYKQAIRALCRKSGRERISLIDGFLVWSGNAVEATLTAAGCARDHSGIWRKRRKEKAMLQISATSEVTHYPTVLSSTREMRDQRVNRAMYGVDENVIAAFDGDRKAAQSTIDAIAADTVRAFPGEHTLHAADDLRAVIVALSRSMGKEKGSVRTCRALLENDASDLRGMLAQECGGSPSPLEALLIDRIVACRLALTVTESEKPTAPGALSEWHKTLDRVQSRYLAAVKTLAQVRRLKLPALALVQVNMNESGAAS